jgi:hypothetical protein
MLLAETTLTAASCLSRKQGVQHMSDEHKEAIRQQENLSSDVIAFCALFARIIMRCLREKNPRIMGWLSLPSQAKEVETGGTPDAA